jgi:WD40 repeat protein
MGEKGCRLWDSATGNCLRLFEESFCASAMDVILSADGCSLVAGNYDDISIHDFDTGAIRKTIADNAGQGMAIKLEPAPNGRFFASMHHKSLCIWNMKTGKLQKAFPSNTWHYSSFAISPDGQMIMCRGRDNKLTIIEIKIGEVHSFHFYGITTSAVDWARRRVSIGFSDGRVEFYDLQGIEVKPFITTAVREIVPPDIDSSPVKARPVCCKQEITIPKPISERIRDWTEKEGSGGYKDPALVLHCPHCGTLLRMNPFFVDVTTSM